MSEFEEAMLRRQNAKRHNQMLIDRVQGVAPTEGDDNSGNPSVIAATEGALAQARAEGRREGEEDMRERAAQVNLDRIGREWVRDSLWANIARDLAAKIRALATAAGKEGE